MNNSHNRRQLHLKESLLALAFLLLLTPLFQGCVSTHQTSDRLGEMRKIKIPFNWGNTSVIVLDYSTELIFEIGQDGNKVMEKETKWMKVTGLDKDGIQYITVPEHKVIEKPVTIKAVAYYPDGSKWTLPQSKITQYEKDFSDSVDKTFLLPKYQKGMLVRLEVEREYHRPEYTGRYLLRDRYPIINRTITLTYPEQVDLHYGVENDEETTIEESFIVENGYKKEKVTASNLVNFRELERTPFPEEFYEGFYISFPPKGTKSYTWQEIGEHYLELSKDAFTISPEVKELAGTIPTPLEINRKIAVGFDTVVKKVRYHGDWSEGHAFLPREASIVLKNGYGDCKELCTILKTLLTVNEIYSFPVLLSTWGHLQPLEKYPTLGGFNHMILAARTEDGSIRYIDGTHSWADADSSYYDSVGRKGLLIEPGKSRFSQITASQGLSNEISTDTRISQGKDYHWMIEGDIKLTGYPALRFYETFQEAARKDLVRDARKLLEDSFNIFPESIEIKEIKSDYVHIAYIADFDENYVTLGKGGFKLNIPALYKQDVDRKLTDKLGPVYLRQFKQNDKWSLPFSKAKSELPSYSSSVAESSWYVGDNTVERRYSQQETLRNVKDSSFGEWNNHLGALENALIWR